MDDFDFNPFDGIEEIKAGPPQKKTKKRKSATAAVDPEALKSLIADPVEPEAPQDPPPKKKARRVNTRAPRKKKEDDDEKIEKKTQRHLDLIRILSAYSRNDILGPHLVAEGIKLDPKKLRRATEKKLEDLLEEVDETLLNKSNSMVTDSVIKTGMYQLESIVHSQSRFKVVGSTNKCFDNEHWRFLLERVKMKHGIGVMKLDPLTELSLLTLQTSALIHAQNALSEMEPEEKIDLSVTIPESALK